jgi:hypothetical protein
MRSSICRTAPISQETWAQIDSLLKEKLCLECDEMWSFVGQAKEKVWIGLALDSDSREVLGVAFVKRDAEGARALWNSLPAVYRQCVVC